MRVLFFSLVLIAGVSCKPTGSTEMSEVLDSEEEQTNQTGSVSSAKKVQFWHIIMN